MLQKLPFHKSSDYCKIYSRLILVIFTYAASEPIYTFRINLIFIGIVIIVVAIILFTLRGAEEAEKVRGGLRVLLYTREMAVRGMLQEYSVSKAASSLPKSSIQFSV